MASCNAETKSCKDEEEVKISSEFYGSLSKTNVIDCDSTDKSILIRKTSFNKGMSIDPSINNSLGSDIMELQCNLRSSCLQTKKKRRKKKRLQIEQNCQIESQSDGSSIKDDSVEPNSHNECGFDINTKTELQCNSNSNCSQAKKRRKKKRRPQIEQNGQIDSHRDGSSLKDDSVGTNSLSDCGDDITTKTELQCTSEPNCSQTKKRRKNKKRLQIEQNGQIDSQRDGSLLKDNSIGTYSCNKSEVDIDTKADLQTVAKLSRSQKKKMRKKQKLNTTAISDKAHGPLAELNLIKVGENAEMQSHSPINRSTDLKKKHDNDGKPGLVESVVDISKTTAPLSELSRSQKKRIRKKRKLNAYVINNKAHGPLAELDLINVEENTLIPENQNNSPGIPSAISVMKDYNNDGPGLDIVEKKNIRTYQMEGKLRTYQRKKRKFLDYEENAEPTMVAREHATSVQVVENVSTEKTSSNCYGDFGCVEIKNVTETEKDVNLDVPIKQGNLPKVSFSSLGGPLVGYADKKLLILDINGLLADIIPCCSTISRKSVFKRPFCDDFLQFCFDKFNVGVWSSRSKKNVNLAVNFLMKGSRHKLLFCWNRSHCTKTGFNTIENKSKPLVLKELKKLWDKLEPGLPWNKGEYNESNTLLLDDSPYKALRNPAHTAVFPHTYRYKDTGDSSLGPGGDLRVYLERLAEAQNVQEYVAQHPFGQQAITESNPSWGFYRKIVSADSNQ